MDALFLPRESMVPLIQFSDTRIVLSCCFSEDDDAVKRIQVLVYRGESSLDQFLSLYRTSFERMMMCCVICATIQCRFGMLPLALWKSGNDANLNAIVRRAEPIVVTLRGMLRQVRVMGNTANQKREPIDCQQNLGVQNEGMKMKFDGSTDFSFFFSGATR